MTTNHSRKEILTTDRHGWTRMEDESRTNSRTTGKETCNFQPATCNFTIFACYPCPSVSILGFQLLLALSLLVSTCLAQPANRSKSARPQAQRVQPAAAPSS